MSSAEYIVDQAHPPLPEERPVRLRPLEREPVIVEPPAPEIAPPPIRSRLLSSLVPPPSRI